MSGGISGRRRIPAAADDRTRPPLPLSHDLFASEALGPFQINILSAFLSLHVQEIAQNNSLWLSMISFNLAVSSTGSEWFCEKTVTCLMTI